MVTPETRQESADGALPIGTANAGIAKATPPANKPWVLAIALVVLTFLAYLPALRCGYVWDDDAYVTKNPLLTAPDGLERIWFSAHNQSQYFPLVYTTLRLERALWGLDPFGYHFVNILLHALNAVLVWTVLRKLALPGSWLAAAIWAVHPVNVESVAWITELKNTQSTLFYLLAVLAWMKFTARETERPWRFYGLALVLQALALFSKTTACTLPAALLLVLWLREQRIRKRRLLEVAPFVALGVAMGLLSVWWESHLGNYANVLDYSFNGMDRVLIATRALWFYAGKLLWPTNLTFSYRRWEINWRDPLQYAWLFGCVVIALFLWWRRRVLGRAPVAAILFFVATLSPLLGFIPLYTFRYTFIADHYQYVASIGLIALFAAAVSNPVVIGRLGRTMSCALSVPLLLALGALTWRQAHIYRNEEILWRDTVAKNPASWMAHNDLAGVLLESGRTTEAMEEAEQTLRIKPDCAEGHYNLGNVLVSVGKVDEGIGHYEQALRINPSIAAAHYRLGLALAREGRMPEAIEHWEQALRINPDYAAVHSKLGVALAEQGQMPKAMQHWEQAVRVNPDDADAHNRLGLALVQQGNIRDAVEHWRQALRVNPTFPGAHCNIGIALCTEGKWQEAAGHFEQELLAHSDNALTHYYLGVALEQMNRTKSAIEQYKLALESNPGLVEAQNRLSRLQAPQ
jgi:tetratricopeptide (TPR) repeat protein